ncbi:MAG: DNA-binding response regulator [Actinomycetia bacterium]|jgi:DNA-binding response OmpR family regulator|nr:DNA-binding response regulator [Actinomycetes bacterium]MDQ1646917.1 two-component system, OmpR family, response regulator [Cryptosporangiaceae bacterium]MDQ1654047.1 two-component system, OmpR family, response regulator [Cryptosporangiaceae bacterium]MDQ1658409.1 two-component system, OmpR family, response regulator [Cryptosporangiaceae bacterium]
MGRVLVVEDEERISRLVARALQEDGHAVQRAGTGKLGLASAVADEFDLVILDLMLPGMDGHEVLDRLLTVKPRQRVLVISAVPEIGARIACLEAGAADFLPKPFALAELLARVHARLRTPEPEPATRWLESGPIRLDLQLRRVETGDSSAELPQREFLLLQHLMRREGRSCSREELLADVWGLSFDPGSNVVDVSVRRLRNKLDRPDRIETVRHVGYRFLAS